MEITNLQVKDQTFRSDDHYTKIIMPTEVETRVLPTILHEIIKPVEKRQIQPQIEREIERSQVNLIVQHQKERVILPTEEQTLILPPKDRVIHLESTVPTPELPKYENTTKTEFVFEKTVKPPIVKEHVTWRIVTEITPIFYRELIPTTVVEKVIVREHIEKEYIQTITIGDQVTEHVVIVEEDIRKDMDLVEDILKDTTTVTKRVDDMGSTTMTLEESLRPHLHAHTSTQN
eukprot:TRINITY_DN7795_c0_g1_i1.p1 TRINITY_DN7795_c0_g1~~TRINITY_DN7795_c0_g1_i1.p1  ORF type:complete len:232 (-),score=61.82 TRINITY_DN7795_c0_g1_i1:44-739(-)